MSPHAGCRVTSISLLANLHPGNGLTTNDEADRSMTTLDVSTISELRFAGPPLAGRRQPPYRKLIAVLGTVMLLFACWTFLAPPVLGGGTSYVITDGVSMLPKFHAGDLVILRKQTTYHVGEVAAYHNGQLGIVVMHRIIAISDGHYSFKGDNNNFVDSFRPTKRQVVGAEWAHVDGLGRIFVKLRDPAAAAVTPTEPGTNIKTVLLNQLESSSTCI